uniref:CG-1 domain-containing protein n=2 Tax=Guillardia theta TaxID=55529 RepID=A0A7S4PPF5_GUITH|mmetsp:Transcript_8421/g.28265  ORF Transcript_8421/g.28265 Transcript_8421/m.28265 type:complete len:546 (+) Transcript_8421:71-1708(+)
MTKFAVRQTELHMQGIKDETNETVFQTSQDVLDVARQRWLKNREVLYVLMNHQSLELEFAKEVVCPPSSGLLVLYDKNIVKRFRRDEHDWKKKKDGKAVREDHEKLKIDGVERLTCCYAHSKEIPTFHRRIYWLLPQQDAKAAGSSPFEEGRQVLVHYLDERCILGDTPASIGKSQSMKSMTKRSRAEKALDLRGELSAGRGARAAVGTKKKAWAQILASSTKPCYNDHDTDSNGRARQSSLTRLLEGTPRVKEEAAQEHVAGSLLTKDLAPHHPREEPFPCGPEGANREDAWKHLAQQVVSAGASSAAEEVSNWHDLIVSSNYHGEAAGEGEQHDDEHAPVWHSLVDKALQQETSNYVCMQWQQLTEKAQCSHSSHPSHLSHSSHTGSLYPFWESFTERISQTAQNLHDHLEPDPLLHLHGEAIDCHRMPLDDDYMIQEDADISALLAPSDHQDILGPQPFHCCETNQGEEEPLSSLPDLPDALAGQQRVGKHPPGPIEAASNHHDLESNQLRHLRDWERMLACHEIQQQQTSMDIGRAFDALQ